MPIPKPNPSENYDVYMSRCISKIVDEYDHDQATAICNSQWANKEMTKMKEESFVLKPNKNENRGKYLSRCSSNSKIKEQFPNMKERLGACLNAFNAYYRYWSKLDEFAVYELPTESCMAENRARGFDYKKSYALCMKKQEDGELLVEPVEFEETNIGDCIKKRMDNDSSLTEDEARKRCSASVVNQPVGGTNPQVVTMGSDDTSIDFDDTLDTDRGFELAKKLMEQGAILHILTRRQEKDSKPVLEIANKLGIPSDRVHFTNGKLKWEMIKRLGIMKHIDNNEDEIKAIKENLPDVEAIKFYDISYAEDKGLEDACWPGYEAIGLKDNGDPNCVPIKMTEDDFADSISDYPEGVKNAAKKAVDYAEKNGWGSCGTQVGKTRASQLANGEPISVDTIKRMYSYLSRHKSDLQSSKDYESGCGKLMYDSWGGEPALTWSERKLKELEGK